MCIRDRGVRVFSCNKPPAILAEWPGSFACHCGSTRCGTDTETRVSTEVNFREDTSPAAPVEDRTRNLPIASPALYYRKRLVALNAKAWFHYFQQRKKKRKEELVGAFSPVNHKGLHQGWTQTSLYLQVIHFTSHHTTSHVFWAFLYSAGTKQGNLHPAGDLVYSAGRHRNHVLAHANTGETRRGFGKMQVNKQGRNPWQ